MWQAVLLVALAITPRVAAAQKVDPRLAARLDSATARAVTLVVDSAAAERLPSEPLIQKALEGATMHASGDRIVRATHGLRTLLRSARDHLGATSNSAELVAGAAALRSGVPPSELAALRQARPATSIAIPLGVLSNLVGRGVPSAKAAESVLTLARRGATDSDFLSFEGRVQDAVRDGKDPGLVPLDPTAGGRSSPPRQ